MKEAEIKEIALSKYPVDEFWIGDSATGKMYDINSRDRATFTKGLKEALNRPRVILNKNHTVPVDIADGDIATIEALHDILIDNHGYSLDFRALKRSRALTEKMYNAFKLREDQGNN